MSVDPGRDRPGVPQVGQTVRMRTRTYVVEAVRQDTPDPALAVVTGACLDDDAQG